MSDAITFSFGGDISNYRRAIAEAVAETRTGAEQIKQAANSAGGEEFKKTGEHAFSAATKMQMLGHAVRSISDQVSAGQSAVRALSMEMGRLGPVLGIGIGAAVGLTAISMLVGKIGEAESEAEKLKQSLNDALLPDNPDFSTIEELKKKLAEVQQVSKGIKGELQSAFSSALTETYGNRIAQLWAKITGGAPVQKFDPTRDSIQAAGKERDLELGVTGKEAGQLAERQTGFSSGADAEARAKAERELNERLGAASKLETHEGRHAAAANAREQYRIEIEELDKKLAKKKEDVALEAELLRIKRQGDSDAGIQEAEARLKAAREDLARANREEEGTAVNKVEAAEEAVRQAEKELHLTQMRHAAELEIASFTGTAEAKKTLELQKQLELAQEIQRLAKPNEKDAADIGVARAQSAITEHNRQTHYATEEADITATTGRGRAQQRERARRELELAREKQGDVYAMGNAASDLDRSQADAAVNKKKKAYDDLDESIRRATEDTELQTVLMEAQADHQVTIAEALQIELHYRDRIAQAIRDGNTELANQLTAQQQIAMHQAGVKRHSMTPAERQAEKAQQRRDKWESNSFDREVDNVQGEMDRNGKQGTHVAGKDSDGHEFYTNDFGTGRRGEIADEIKNADKIVREHHAKGLDKDIKNGAEYLKRQHHESASGKSEFANALEKSKVLTDIRDNTKGMYKNR